MTTNPADEEFTQGYIDGRDPTIPPPGENRHPAYIHSFKVGRAEIEKAPIPAHVSRARAKLIEENCHDQ